MAHGMTRWPSLAASVLLATTLLGCPQRAPVTPAAQPETAMPAPHGSLAGRIHHATSGAPVGDALVTVGGTDRQVTTDVTGWFTLADLPLGPVTLQISGPGFEPFAQEIAIHAGLQGVDLVVGQQPANDLPFIRAFVGTLPDGRIQVGEGLVIHGDHFGDTIGEVLANGAPLPMTSWRNDRIEVFADAQRVSGGSLTVTVRRPDGAQTERALDIDPLVQGSSLGGTASGGGGSSGGSGDGAGGGTPTAAPTPGAPQANTLYASAFGDAPEGPAPPDWVDVRQDMVSPPSWLFPGHWLIASQTGSLPGKVLRQEQTAPQPYFSMRRYAGNAFQSGDGALPAVYTVMATVQPGDSPFYRSPTGEVSLLVHYRDCRNYVQLVLSDATVALYEAVDAQPLIPDGWHGRMWFPVAGGVGTVHTIGARVDTVNGTVQPVVDGQWYWPLPVASVSGEARHWVALRSAGNAMAVGDVQIDSRD